MENSIYLGLGRQMVLRRELEIVANNVANSDTTAYKSEQPVFKEYLSKPQPNEIVSYVLDYGKTRNMAEGRIRPTGNDFDLAIQGRGYFAVQTAAGERYSRNGVLQLDAEGRLVNGNGQAVLDVQGRPIVVPPGTGKIDIASDGSVTAGTQVLGQLRLAGFRNEQALKPAANGVFIANETPGPAPNAKVVQGAIEESNVVPVHEIGRMIEITRGYEQVQLMMDGENNRLRDTVRRLGRAPGA
ncbi:MAG: flagellar basal-body rod protein FlgF [Proteobacteria bacterium]|nr:flagellar basal-body rod protein FlgF [Pseudomonadota bacterium]